MTVELRPLGVKCNIQCQYCYQNPQRNAGNVASHYDLNKMKAAIEKIGQPFGLFGGEALLVPEADLEELWSWGFQKFGSNSLQTNGTLITDNHIRLFKQYNVRVGISIDGPDELNDVRWAGTLERTRQRTAQTIAAIDRLCQEGIPPKLIITLHQGNASRDKLPILQAWVKSLEKLGITTVRLHILEVEAELIKKQYALSLEENLEAFISFYELEKTLTTLKFDIFQEMRKLLLGQDDYTSCVWNACDPYTTQAVQGIEGYGQRSNCGRTNKDGIDFVKSSTEGYERYLALYQTPQEYGGCKGCRFFLMCKGQCPGTAIDGDWRNRSEYCEVWKGLYEHLETELIQQEIVPLSIDNKREQLEQILLETWRNGHHVGFAYVLNELEESSPEAKLLNALFSWVNEIGQEPVNLPQ